MVYSPILWRASFQIKSTAHGLLRVAAFNAACCTQIYILKGYYLISLRRYHTTLAKLPSFLILVSPDDVRPQQYVVTSLSSHFGLWDHRFATYSLEESVWIESTRAEGIVS